MKNKTKPFLIGGVLLLIVGLTLLFIFNGGTAATGDTQPGSFISVPNYGYLKCQAGQSDATYPSGNTFNKFSHIVISCRNYGQLVQSCIVNLKMPSSSEVGNMFSAMTYKVCDITDSACINSGSGATTFWARQAPWINNAGELNAIHSVTITRNQQLVSQYNEYSVLGAVFGGDTATNKGRYQVVFRPYFIYRYDDHSATTGQQVYNTEDCSNGGNLGEANLLIEGVTGGGGLSSGSNALQPSQILDLNNLRAPDAQATYISAFAAIVPQYNLFDSDTKYCVDKKIYAVETVETVGGTYKVANTGTNKALQTVACCNNGDVPSGYYCSNFQLVKLSDSDGASCSVLNPCPVVGYQPIAGKKVVSQECVSGLCKTTYTNVACNNAFDCTSGYCIVDPSNPSNNHCGVPQEIKTCGNGACELSRGETAATCPKDCYGGGNKIPSLLWWIIGVLAVLVVIVIIILIVRNRNQGGKTIF